MVKRLCAVLIVLLIPLQMFAAEPLTRRDAFLQIWQSIKRPALPAKTAFSDLSETERGSLEIDYAVARKLIEDDEMFRPDEPVVFADVLVWLFRTRNVADDPTGIQPATLQQFLDRYPIASLIGEIKTVTAEDLTALIHLLDTQLMEEVHEASLYSEKFHGKGTAFGESFDMHAMTAAHRSFPHNTMVKVTNVANGKSVIVRINDRGPFVKGRDMDLSLGAFTSIESRSKGKLNATFQRLGDVSLVSQSASVTPTPPSSQCAGHSTMQRRVSRGVVLTRGVPQQFSLGATLTLDANKSFVVRGVKYPDGTINTQQDFVLKNESYAFTPSMEGKYQFKIGSVDGRSRWMTMAVQICIK
jgi:rare lipoprotein A